MRKQAEINVDEKKWIVKELLAIEMDDINFDDKKQALRQQVKLSTGISDEDYNLLTVKERLTIIQKINELNGAGDFQMNSQ